MAIYVKPGAYSRFIETAGTVILGAGTRIPAIIGPSYTYKIAEETLVRGSIYPYQPDTADALSHSGVTEILSVGNIPYTSDYTENSDFQLVNDSIDWSLGGDEPSVGDKYYVRYKYAKSTTDYNPKLLYRKSEAQAEYGEELSDNPLMIALSIYFENGPAPVVAVQTNGTNVQAFKNAIDLLKNQVEGADVTHLIALSTESEIHTYLLNHVLTMSSMFQKKERRALISTAINTTSGDMKAKANAMANERIIYVPQWASRNIKKSDGTYDDFTLDGTYVSCAILGQMINRNIEESITNEAISGFKELSKIYLEDEADDLANEGILLLYSKGGIIKVRHDITTSTATPEENQWSVGEIKDYVIKNVRDVLENQWLAKSIYGAETVGNIQRTVSATLDKFIESRIITDYNGIEAVQNAQEPRRIDVTFNFKPVYPLMWIFINFSIIKS